MPVKSSYPDVVFPEQSLYDFLIERVRKEDGESVAQIDNSRGGKSMTFKEIDEYSQNCAGFLYKNGLRKGDRVAICTDSCVEFSVISLSILACGATIALYNPAFTKDELLQLFNVTKPKIAFVYENALNNIIAVQKEIDSLKDIFVIGNSQEFTTIKTMIESEHKKGFPTDVEVDPDEDVAFMPHSSGTTGLPKCVMLTHKNIISCIILMSFMIPTKHCKTLYNDRPISHAGGFLLMFASLAEGTKVIMDVKHDLKIMLQAIQDYRVTHFIAIPPVMIRYVHAKDTKKYDTSSLHTILCGGASLSPEIIKKMSENLNCDMIPVYGTTEAGFISVNLDVDDCVSSVGALLPNIKAKIIHQQTGKELLAEMDGELLIKGPIVMKGYFNNEEATTRAFTKDGWYHTGDLAHFDKNKRLFITARIKEIIKYKAVQVSPAELESVILKHPKVADVGVIGIPDEYDGELPKAFVVKKHSSLTADEVTSFLNEKVIDYKRLRGGVQFVHAIPKSAEGKIQRRELKKMAGF